MNKTLFILNTFYPFSRQEDFLANEIQLIKGFEKVVVFPNSVSCPNASPLYQLPENISFVPNTHSYKQTFGRCILKCLLNKAFYEELWILVCSRRLSIERLKCLISFMLYSLNSYNTIESYIKDSCGSEEIIVYSYWLHVSAFVGCLLKRQFSNIKVVVSRCHRFDLYEYANGINYIPQRKFIFSNLDEIHSISEDGIKYLSLNYPEYVKKYKLSRLGTYDHGMSTCNNDNVLRIVSCSWMRKVKRIHRIFESIKDAAYPIEWTHFGDGETFYEIKNLVDANNNINVKVILAGNTDNSDVIESYKKNNYDVFVNVSENEGVPVSIMEAMSCGLIPIATDVGGTRELIENEVNGFLLPSKFENGQLGALFSRVYQMSNDEKRCMRQEARNKWSREFNAMKNYTLFYKHLTEL